MGRKELKGNFRLDGGVVPHQATILRNIYGSTLSQGALNNQQENELGA
jgi:hypothetical protein